MGSYNASCAITALPIKWGTKAVLAYYYKKDSSFSRDCVTFLGVPFEGTYDDYGEFSTENNPLFTCLKPDFEKNSGLLPLKLEEVSPYKASILSFFALNLHTHEQEMLHFCHSVMDLYVKKLIDDALQKSCPTKTDKEYSCSEVLSFENSKDSELKELFKQYVLSVDQNKKTYSQRSDLIHAALNNFESSKGTLNLNEFIKDEKFEIDRYLDEVLLRLDLKGKVSSKEAKALFLKRMCLKVHLAAMHPSAFEKMVYCAKKQLGSKKCKTLEETLKAQNEAYFKDLQDLESKFKHLEADKAHLCKVLLRSLKRESRLNSSAFPSVTGAFCGALLSEIPKEYFDLAFFELNFDHGFRFSASEEPRQYEGIAHLEAAAKATLEVLKNHKKDFYLQGSWETFQYDKE